MEDNHTADSAAALTAGFGLIGFLIVIAVIIFGIVIYWRIASKAGYNGAMSLLLFIPLVNVVIVCIFASAKWPIEVALALAQQSSRAPSPLNVLQ